MEITIKVIYQGVIRLMTSKSEEIITFLKIPTIDDFLDSLAEKYGKSMVNELSNQLILISSPDGNNLKILNCLEDNKHLIINNNSVIKIVSRIAGG